MKKIPLFIIHLIFFSSAYSQNYIYKGDKSFPATDTWQFEITNESWSYLEVNIGKTSFGGYMMLATEVPFNESISGNVFLIMANGKTANLVTKVVNDHVDGKSQVLYNISSSLFKMLKETSIIKIRFSLKNPPHASGGKTGNYTASNPPIKEYPMGDVWNTQGFRVIGYTYDTANDISKLGNE